MFDDKQIEQYRSVKASPELGARVASLEKSGRIYAFNRRAVSAIAACLVAVIALGSYFGSRAEINADLTYGPYQMANYARSGDIKVGITLDTKGAYTVTVESGELHYNGEAAKNLELEGEAELEWLAPVQGEHILTVKKGLIIRQYRLFLTEQGWQLEKV